MTISYLEQPETDMNHGLRSLDAGVLMEGAVRRWVFNGILPGHFLTAVLENNLKEAVLRADPHNLFLLKDWITFLYNSTPAGCWGSPANVKDWAEAGGIVGLEARAKKKEKKEKEEASA